MLEIIQQTIKNLPDISFNEFFIQYVMSVQDTNLDVEFISIFKSTSCNVSDIVKLERLVNRNHERLMGKNDK